MHINELTYELYTVTDKRNIRYIIPDFVALLKSLKHAVFINEICSLESKSCLALLLLQVMQFSKF